MCVDGYALVSSVTFLSIETAGESPGPVEVFARVLGARPAPGGENVRSP